MTTIAIPMDDSWLPNLKISLAEFVLVKYHVGCAIVDRNLDIWKSYPLVVLPKLNGIFSIPLLLMGNTYHHRKAEPIYHILFY